MEADESLNKPEAKAERRYRTREQKLEIVEETLKPGASVALVARAHGVNANQLFAWRKLHRRGKLIVNPPSLPQLLPVRVTEEDSGAPLSSYTVGAVHVELAKGRLRFENIDERTLRTLLECLRG